MLNDPLFPVLLALRYAHILGAIALMGSALFMRLALAPSVAEINDETRKQLHEKVRSRWAKFVHLSIMALLISGVANLGLASRYEFGEGPNYSMLAGIKFLLALPIFFIASMLAGRSASAAKFQAKQTMWLNVNLFLAIVMVLMGGFLRAIPRQLKSEAKAAPVQTIDTPETPAAK